MKLFSPLGMIIIGLGGMVLGIVLPLFMLLKMIPTGFFLSFIAYGASVAGLVLAIVGLSMYVRSNRHIDYH